MFNYQKLEELRECCRAAGLSDEDMSMIHIHIPKGVYSGWLRKAYTTVHSSFINAGPNAFYMEMPEVKTITSDRREPHVEVSGFKCWKVNPANEEVIERTYYMKEALESERYYLNEELRKVQSYKRPFKKRTKHLKKRIQMVDEALAGLEYLHHIGEVW